MDSARQSSIDLSRQRIALARDMIAVHGPNAAGVARENARSDALAGRAEQARNWLKTLDVIQRMARS
jgi:hypothetical protein